jgi:hypothetical protein
MDSAQIAVQVGVGDLLARYQYLADTGRVDQLALVFAPDAVYETNTGRHVGRDAILDFFRGVGSSFIDSGLLPARHHLSSILITDRGDGTASVYSCWGWVGTKGLDHWGNYRDEVVEIDGTWQFTRRRATVEGYVPGSPSARLLGLEAATEAAG